MSEPRLYGNWQRPQALTFRGVGWKGAVIVAVGYFAGLATVQTYPLVGTGLLIGAALVTLVSAIRIDGSNLADVTTAKARWRYAEASGATRLSAVQVDGWKLPGFLAHTRLLDVEVSGRRFGAVHDPGSRRLAVTLELASTAAELTDHSEHELAVARWERWLEAVGRRPEVVHASVTVETAPSAGTRLREEVQRRLSSLAPPDCRTLMESLAVASPGVAARTQTRLTIAFGMREWDARVRRGQRRQGIEAFLPLLDQAVNGLEADVAGCGVRVLGRATAEELTATVRAAFDPRAGGVLEAALAGADREIPVWDVAGPVTAVEHRDRYTHDGATSVSFVWAQAPRQLVPSSVLGPLMRPGQFRKRITCTYTATPSTEALDAATEQVRRRWAAEAIARLPLIGRPTTAQDERDTDAARQSTVEVASGAGWVAQTITATTTVLDDEDLAAAVAELEHAAGSSQLRLRRLRALQAAGFVTGLPAGLALHELARRWNR